ncbi:hypothetical protein IG631_03689 [Alternaria alternata]|jgi:hypothetical protein|nr:hypothetical protein IG631_03689 [Alternaria alternata]
MQPPGLRRGHQGQVREQSADVCADERQRKSSKVPVLVSFRDILLSSWTYMEWYCDAEHCAFLVRQWHRLIWVWRSFDHLTDDGGEFVSHCDQMRMLRFVGKSGRHYQSLRAYEDMKS